MATINIKNLNIVASWDYTSTNKDCVCKRSLHLPTISQIEKKNLYRNDIVFGECGHGMHSECISNYIKENGCICPIDNIPWNQTNNNYKIKYSMIK
jgi:hypothetical protein